MVDLDAKVIELSRRYLPSYSNCTAFGTPSCFDDPRADVFAQDFFEWFDENMGADICDKRSEKSNLLYDVIVLDLLDPEALPLNAPFAKYLYSEEFFQKISCALSNQGVLVSNFGEAPESPFDSGPVEPVLHPMFKKRIAMFQEKLVHIRNLSKNFHHTRVYDASVPSYRASWSFVIGMVPRIGSASLTEQQIHQGLEDFDGSAKDIDHKLKESMIPGSMMKIYSGAVHNRFKYPNGDWKGVWCANVERREVCKDPMKLFQTMDATEQQLWHPLVDSIREQLPVSI
jgi:spermidine synthase